MACINGSLPSFSSVIFVSDLPSYGLIALVIIGLILYFAYAFTFVRSPQAPCSSGVYMYFSQFALLLLLISPITFLFRPSASVNVVCPMQTLSLQILPFCLLLGLNVHFAHGWLVKLTNPLRRSALVAISSFLIFFLGVLIQTAILLVWFYNNNNNPNQQAIDQCTTECPRPLFLCSLLFNFFLLFLYSLRSSIRYHLHNQPPDFIYLLTSLFAVCVTITWICLYLFLPLRSVYTFYMSSNYILAYGTLFFAYAFLGPFVYEQIFTSQQLSSNTGATKAHANQINKMTFKCLSLTKEQQRAFMAAYIKRNLTASCESLTVKNLSAAQQSHPTRHSTLSVDSLCPTLISTVSCESPPMMTHDPPNCGTLTSEYLLFPTSNETKS